MYASPQYRPDILYHHGRDVPFGAMATACTGSGFGQAHWALSLIRGKAEDAGAFKPFSVKLSCQSPQAGGE